MKIKCPIHGEVQARKNKVNGVAYPYCMECRLEKIRTERQRRKQLLVDAAGGKCVVCGYSKCLEALEFHHLDPTVKEDGLKDLMRVNMEKAVAEAQKCVLVCANCHREIHADLTKV